MIIDGHTDVLWKMLKNENLDFYKESSELSVNYPNLVKGDVALQVFAIFVSTLKSARFMHALQSIDDFYEKICNENKLRLAKNYADIEKALEAGRKAGILSLEGAEALEGDIGKLRILYRLGVRAIGLTWNHANEAADGVGEERNAGLSNFGKLVVSEMNKLGMMIDVSHLSPKGFWDVMRLSKSPILASHSNVKSVYDHPRNLDDDQIKAIIDVGGVIGVTFVRGFTADENPSVEDLIPHIDYIAELGGAKNIGLGSDFDGATTLIGLENSSQYYNLGNALSKKYNNEFIKGVLGQNWLNYYKRVLK